MDAHKSQVSISGVTRDPHMPHLETGIQPKPKDKTTVGSSQTTAKS